jgi:hypothetical protein
MLAVIPEEVLQLATGAELQFLTCGDGIVSVEALKKIMQFSGLSDTDAIVRYFWGALGEMTNEQRQLYLRFVTGWSRLPPATEGSKCDFRIQISVHGSRSSGTIDQQLPVSHTCFDTLELPAYTSKEILKKKMIYAITNCTSIDGDFEAHGGYDGEADGDA